MHWGHKASILGFPVQEVPLDAIPVSDASTNDGMTVYPHIVKFFKTYPELKGEIDTLIYDSAADISGLMNRLGKEFGIELRATLNPGRKKKSLRGFPGVS